MNETFRALVLSEADGKVEAAIETLPTDRLPDGDVTVAVEYSTLNYKDGLIVNGLGRLVRSYPHVPGVDFAGTVTAADRRFAPGDKVVLTGWRVGERHWGGYAQQARVKGDWLVKLPTGLTHRAGDGDRHRRARRHAGRRGAGGSWPGRRGRATSWSPARRAASAAWPSPCWRRPATGSSPRPAGWRWPTTSRASARRMSSTGRPWPRVRRGRWIPSVGGGCVDAVGGATLAAVLSQLRYSASVAACGLAGGSELATTVIPFLLRGVNLLGIDTVMQPRPARERAWARLARDMPAERLAAMTTVVPLAEVPALARAILDGKLRGRTVVDVNR